MTLLQPYLLLAAADARSDVLQPPASSAVAPALESWLLCLLSRLRNDIRLESQRKQCSGGIVPGGLPWLVLQCGLECLYWDPYYSGFYHTPLPKQSDPSVTNLDRMTFPCGIIGGPGLQQGPST